MVDTFELTDATYRHVAHVAEGTADLSFGIGPVTLDLRPLLG